MPPMLPRFSKRVDVELVSAEVAIVEMGMGFDTVGRALMNEMPSSPSRTV